MWDDPLAPEWGKRRKERACDGELIEGQRKTREKEKHIIHGGCTRTMKRSTGGHLIRRSKHSAASGLLR